MTPTCPIHQTPMNAGRYPGSFYCPRKNPDGSYCASRVSAPKVQAQYVPPPAQPPGPQPTQGMAAACLAFAARVYQGTGMSQEASALARSLFEEWRNS